MVLTSSGTNDSVDRPYRPIMPSSNQLCSPRPKAHGPRSYFTHAIIVSCTLCIIHVAGCGRDDTTVSVGGEVSYKGEPVEMGEIEFTPMEGTSGPATGCAIEGGRYALAAERGLQPGGTYLVQIRGMKNTGRSALDPFSGAESVEVMDHFIPEEYNARSTLRISIKGDSSSEQLDFDLPQDSP